MSSLLNHSLLWVAPEKKGGINSYTRWLWGAVSQKWQDGGGEICGDGVLFEESVDQILNMRPTLLHIQHEFGLFGRKFPPVYRFPRFVKRLRRELPNVRIVATAHNVLGEDYSYPVRGYGWQSPARWLANTILLSYLRRVWIQDTWGQLDGVIVHSSLQADTIRKSGCRTVDVIPHYVPQAGGRSFGLFSPVSSIPKETCVLLEFGFITYLKGQDVLIRALPLLRHEVVLVLAGAARTKRDRRYLQHCLELSEKLGVRERVVVTGFVPDDIVPMLYERACVAVAPFRLTAGSGSLAMAFRYGAPIVASDIPLNEEIAQRERNCLALFKSGDPGDCAKQVDTLIDNLEIRMLHLEAMKRYASSNDPSNIATKHIEFYRNCVNNPVLGVA